jgi:hypothetical protein
VKDFGDVFDAKKDAQATMLKVGKDWHTNEASDTRTFQKWEKAAYKWTETDQIIEQFVVKKGSCVVRTSSAGTKPGSRFFELLRVIREQPEWHTKGALYTYVPTSIVAILVNVRSTVTHVCTRTASALASPSIPTLINLQKTVISRTHTHKYSAMRCMCVRAHTHARAHSQFCLI